MNERLKRLESALTADLIQPADGTGRVWVEPEPADVGLERYDPKDNWTLLSEVSFKMHSETPRFMTTAEILTPLLQDAATWENCRGDVEAWANELGFDSEEMDVQKRFDEVTEQVTRLQEFLGDLYEKYVWEQY